MECLSVEYLHTFIPSRRRQVAKTGVGRPRYYDCLQSITARELLVLPNYNYCVSTAIWVRNTTEILPVELL